MRLSDKFIKTVKLSEHKNYELSRDGDLTQVSFSQYLNNSRPIIGDKEKLLKIGTKLELKKEDCFIDD